MKPLTEEIASLNEGIIGGFAFAALLVLTYFNYDKNAIFRGFGNIFIKFSFVKRDKRDLLVFALIPFAIGMFALIFRIMLM
jgi:hypothetical protein